MPSKNYWINRANRRMDDYILQSEETANEITKAYYVASKRIEKEMVRVVQGLGAISDDRTALKYLKNPQSKSVIRTIRKAVSTMPDGPEKDEALTLISSPAYLYRMRRLQAVIDNARKECNRLYKVELKDATAHLRNLYNDAFSHTIYDIDKGYNTLHTFSMFPASRVNTLLKSEWSGANYSERIWNSTQNLADSLKEQLLISFMTGASVSKTAREISERFQVSAYNARRLVRTESNYIANQAEHDAYKRLGVEEYQFIATLDTRTSKLCRELDGRVFNVEDGKPGINMPPMHPNCRSTTIMYDADSPIKSRAARDENGKLISVPGNMTYKQWLKEYHPELVDKAAESGIMKITQKLSDRSYNIHNETDNGIIDMDDVHAELEKTQIGRDVLDFIESEGYSVEMNYDLDQDMREKGSVLGKTISINAIAHEDEEEVAQTIIHEAAHKKYSWDETMEDEVNCRILEYLHVHETISDQKISEIVAEVRENYSVYPEGELYGY